MHCIQCVHNVTYSVVPPPHRTSACNTPGTTAQRVSRPWSYARACGSVLVVTYMIPPPHTAPCTSTLNTTHDSENVTIQRVTACFSTTISKQGRKEGRKEGRKARPTYLVEALEQFAALALLPPACAREERTDRAKKAMEISHDMCMQPPLPPHHHEQAPLITLSLIHI